MAETAGLMLLRAGLLTQEQLAQANQARRQHGGTLGAHLIALGIVGEGQLADFYRHRLMVPRIGREALEAVTKKVIAIVPPDMAAEFRVVPVSVDREGNLTLAMADPSDTHAVDEVGFFTGHFVMRAVTTESTIEWALEKYYGIATSRIPGAAPAPAEAAPAAAPAPAAPAAAPAPAPAPPAVEPLAATTVAAVTATAPLAPPTPIAAPTDEGEVVLLTKPKITQAVPVVAAPAPAEVEAAAEAEAPLEPRLMQQLEAEAAASAAPAAPAPAPAPAPTPPVDEGVTLVQVELSLSGRVAAVTASDAPAASPAAVALTEAIRALRGAATPEEVASALLEYFASFCGRAAFFTVRKSTLRCEQSRGDGVTPALLAFNVSVEEPSVFREVIASRFPYRGALGDSPAVKVLLGGLPPPGAEDAVLVPIAVRHRVVSIAYGDRLAGAPSEAGMTRVALEAGIAYERLIAARKEASGKTEA